MTDSKRKRHSPAFKGQVALAAYKGDKTTSQLTSEYGIAATQISQWKSHLVKQAAELFGKTKPAVNPDSLTAPLYEEIGRLKIELDWLKKNSSYRLTKSERVLNRLIQRLVFVVNVSY